MIQPVNNIEKNKCDGKDHPGPLVYEIDISQVRYLDSHLGCPPLQVPFLMKPVRVQRAPGIEGPARRGPSVLQAGTIRCVHGALGITTAQEHI